MHKYDSNEMQEVAEGFLRDAFRVALDVHKNPARFEAAHLLAFAVAYALHEGEPTSCPDQFDREEQAELYDAADAALRWIRTHEADKGTPGASRAAAPRRFRRGHTEDPETTGQFFAMYLSLPKREQNEAWNAVADAMYRATRPPLQEAHEVMEHFYIFVRSVESGEDMTRIQEEQGLESETLATYTRCWQMLKDCPAV